MRLIKTICIWLMVLAMAVAITACKPSNQGETTTAAPTSNSGETTTASSATTPATTTTAASVTTKPGETTAAPTTADGTTAAPTTAQPGTISTTTIAETTVPVTTIPTTTASATTAAPTTALPTTAAPTTAASTTAAGGESRATYSSALEPVYTIADITEVGPPLSRQFLLPEVYTGNVTINFDMTTVGRSHDWMVGFVSDQMVSEFRYYTHMSIQVAMNSFNIQAINGGEFVRFDTLLLGATYHVRIQANMDSHTYTAYITAPGSAEAMIGTGNFAFRTRGQNPVDTRVSAANNLAMVVVGGARDNQGYMENLVITDDTP